MAFSRVGRVQRDDLALDEKRDAIAQLVGLLHVVRGEDDRGAALRQVGDDPVQVARGARIQSARRLVEEEHLRVVEQRPREQQPLAHAGGERLGPAALRVGQADALENLLGARARQAVELAEQLEVLHRREALVQRGVLGDQVDLGANAFELAREVVAEHLRLAGRRPRAAGEDAQRRRLAGAVVTEQAEDLTGLRIEGDAVKRLDAAVVLGEVGDADSR